MQFTFNYYNPLGDKLHDSMQLDSGICLAELKLEEYNVYIKICGEVRVLYNPDESGKAEDGQVYKHASDMPDELLNLFGSENYPFADKENIYIANNNWFEIFIDKKEQWTGYSDVVDIDSYSPTDVLTLCLETLQEYKSEYGK